MSSYDDFVARCAHSGSQAGGGQVYGSQAAGWWHPCMRARGLRCVAARKGYDELPARVKGVLQPEEYLIR
jgi:hypothetical protein